LGVLGAAVAGKRRATKGGIAGLFVIIPSFLFFFGMSAFFSYTYYHANLFNLSAKKLAGETQPMELAVAVLPGMSLAVGQANEDQIKKIGATGYARLDEERRRAHSNRAKG
jgi:hypothetical protein